MVMPFRSMHNPESKKYALYYSTVLCTATGAVIFMTFQVIHPTLLQCLATFFEGFFSLFMLARNKKVEVSFISHLSEASSSIKAHLPIRVG